MFVDAVTRVEIDRPAEPDRPVQKALRELIAKHRVTLPGAVEAYAEAMAVVDELDTAGDFETANRGKALYRNGAGISCWPTAESERRRRALPAR